ncbi:Na+/H+ antiporter subunit E [Streptomyces sp. JJ66]|uniref:Na+/H+ antiporter subunit E n=1 Tax=Streptomyces sp. JJ66 TaxID=2803843 RepID=UPI001C57303A|nr:Na+/H+ antiporter subunit E [Streptomyces sp. JJ66]MBW1603966.1 Na+/H+ antiporter subunit E [Streptomyces sp. JJ66]
MTRPSPRPRPRTRQLLGRLPSVLWLWLLWVLLWSPPTAVVVTGGLLVSVGVVAAFRLPEVSPQVSVRPLRLLRLAAAVLWDIVASAVAIAWAAVRHGPRVRAAVVEMPLTADTDLLVTATSLLTTMTPGSLVLEIDRERRLLYVHVLPVTGPADAEAERQRLRSGEARLIAALGRTTPPDADSGPQPPGGGGPQPPGDGGSGPPGSDSPPLPGHGGAQPPPHRKEPS